MAYAKPLATGKFTESDTIFSGLVVNVMTENFRVISKSGDFIEAALAASCLIAPQQGSEVLLAAGSKGYFILAVLTHPAKTLVLQAKEIKLQSETLILQNKATHIKTNELRFDTRRLLSFAKKAYSEMGQLFQKISASYVEVDYQKVKSKSHLEETKGLRYTQAGTLSEKADVVSTQADKILIN